MGASLVASALGPSPAAATWETLTEDHGCDHRGRRHLHVHRGERHGVSLVFSQPEVHGELHPSPPTADVS